MRTVGIIVEYNPLHNGHVHHFEQSMKAAGAEACIAVMSGHFLQRGEPAIVNKWARTEMALRMGADVVIELPAAYACQPAEWFAYGAVKLLDATGVTDALCFGSENGELGPLRQLAAELSLESAGFRQRLREELDKGLSYPSAYAAAAQGGDTNDAIDAAASALNQPNNILGLHYLMALNRLQSPIEPLTIPRTIAGYHQTSVTDASIASATAIRKLLLQEGSRLSSLEALERIAELVPAYTLDILRREFSAGRGPLCWEHYAVPLFTQLLALPETELRGIYEVTEGLENRIKQTLSRMPSTSPLSVESLVSLLKTKRYTHVKLQRTLLRILLQHSKEELSREHLGTGPSYIRVLGFSGRGRLLMKEMKTAARLPLVTKAARESSPFLGMDIRAGSVYSLGYREQAPDQWLRDYYQAPVQI